MHAIPMADLVICHDTERTLSVSFLGEPVGAIELYSNRFHENNQYLRLHLSRYEPAWAAPLFSYLRHAAQKPLQDMHSSQGTQQAAFLMAGGFACKRKCFELEVTAKDYSSAASATPLTAAQRGQPEYAACCQRLYSHYQATHAAISPLTADVTAFCEHLPPKVFFSSTDAQIQHFAFVEANEIAYVGSIRPDGIRAFAEAVVSKLLAEYESICFECDDCDAASMALKSLFSIDVQESYDTYVRP